jgi:hypothetical protein
MDSVTIISRLPPELAERLDAWASTQQRSRSAAIRMLIEQALAGTRRPRTPAPRDVTAQGTLAIPKPGMSGTVAVRNPQTPTQRSKAITDAYTEAEPLSKWPAVNAIVLRAIQSERYTDEQVRDAILRMAADKRAVTLDSLRTELDGPPVTRRRSTTDDRVAALQAMKDPEPGRKAISR